MNRRPLADIEAKLDRAAYHLDTLKDRVEEWSRSEQPHGIDRHVDEGKRLYVFFYVELKPFPRWVGIIGGEAVHQMRSALDHLVARVVERQGGQVTTATGFPIIDTRLRWETRVEPRRKWWQLWRKKSGGPLKGIDPNSEAWALIKSAQPYQRGKLAKTDRLYSLNDSWNRDKHRSINLLWMVTDKDAILNQFSIDPPIEPIERIAFLPPNGTLVDGATIARFRFPADQPLPEVDVEHPLPRDIRIGNPQQGDEALTLPDTLAWIREFIDKFSKLV